VAGFNFAWADANETVVILGFPSKSFYISYLSSRYQGIKERANGETKLNPF
jgi:hypothetical protein